MSEKKNKPKKEITAQIENISKSQEKKILKKVKKDLKADGQNDE